MPKSQEIAPLLPFLRRYARVLTGNQKSGDAYVAATIQALTADPSLVKAVGNPRVALYRLFTGIWESVPVGSTGPSDAQLPADQRLSHLPTAAPGLPVGRTRRIFRSGRSASS